MDSRPQLAFVGPVLAGSNLSAPTQAYILANLFEEEGYPVFRFSTSMNRYWRPIDIALSLIRYRNKIDISLIQVYSGNTFRIVDLASYLCKLLGIHQIMVLHGGNLPLLIKSHPEWVKRVLERADQIVVPSQFLQKEMCRIGLEAKVIHNVINANIYPHRVIEQARPTILWMRSFGEVYNPFMAVRVIAELRKYHANARLSMAGPDHGLLAKTRQLASQLNVENNIEWLGYINHQQKIDIAQQADIYINTNIVDNMPVSLLEMAALGLPIVTTEVGGIPYLWHDKENCILVPNNDVKAMTAAINQLLQDSALVNHLTTQARSTVKKMNWRNIQKLWEQEIFEQF